jgi:hypothetical protein
MTSFKALASSAKIMSLGVKLTALACYNQKLTYLSTNIGGDDIADVYANAYEP